MYSGIYWAHKCLAVLFTTWRCQKILKLHNNDAERLAILVEYPFYRHSTTSFQQHICCWHTVNTDLGITKLISKYTLHCLNR